MIDQDEFNRLAYRVRDAIVAKRMSAEEREEAHSAFVVLLAEHLGLREREEDQQRQPDPTAPPELRVVR